MHAWEVFSTHVGFVSAFFAAAGRIFGNFSVIWLEICMNASWKVDENKTFHSERNFFLKFAFFGQSSMGLPYRNSLLWETMA